MLEIQLADPYIDWRDGLDPTVRARMAARLRKLSAGLWGDHKPVGGGVVELREHFGAGYRIYVTRRGAQLVIVLGGGDKSSQSADIKRAIELVGML